MKKTSLVILNEIVNRITRPSFIIVTFGIPILGFLLFNLVTNLNQDSSANIGEIFVSSVEEEDISEGFVDHTGMIKVIPSDVSPTRLIRYENEASALQASENGEISAYYIVPADVVQSGKIDIVKLDFSPVDAEDNSWIMDWTLAVNLMDGDEILAAQVSYPTNEEWISLEPEIQNDSSNPLSFFVPYGTTMIFYILILGSASTLMDSISKEKSNQVIEVLLLSTSPKQLIAGKIIGLGITALLQTAMYTTIGYTLLKISGGTFEAAANFALDPNVVVWGLVFFICGYTIYAAIMAGAGALAPNTKEASQVTFIVIIPLVIPLALMSVLIEKPFSALAIGLSLFPLTAPVAMMTRLTSSVVPVWQLLTAVALMVGTAYLIILLVARLFRAQTLLSGQEFNIRVFFKALVGKA
ncbi:MAG: ABC transporter permease [Chloroflexota bacterium]